MLENIVYTIVLISLTTIAGLSITPKKLGRMTRLALAYSLGFTIISLTGLLATALDTKVFLVQLSALILSGGYYLCFKEKHQEITKEEKAVLVVCSIYILLSLYLLSRIPTWMAGDTLERAIEIRMFLDGKDIPVSVFPFGTYWAQYPKAFQAYTSFWVKLLGIEIAEALKVIPIVLSLYAPLGLYAIVTEFRDRKVALYSLILACFGFIPHTAFLVWGGFTTLAGEMLLVAVILAYIVEKRLLLLFLAGVLFAHPRALFFVVLILGSWIAASKLKEKKVSGVVVLALLAVLVLIVGSFLYGITFAIKQPLIVLKVIKERTLEPIYFLTWALTLVAILGFIRAIKRRVSLDVLSISWTLSLSALALIVGLGVLSTHRMSLDRILTELYLPLSVLGAYFFCFVEEKLAGNIKQIRHIIVALLMFSGILTSTFFIESYYKPWGLPQQDYDAFQWLKNQGYEKTIAVNLDSTGMWAYPLARIELVDPFMFTYNPPQYIKDTAYRPNSDTTLEYMRNLSKTSENVLIYISSVSTTRPNYKPPFTRFYGFYLSVNASAFDERYYHRVYDRDGVFIFEYIEGK